MSTNDFTSNTENKDENEANINKQVSENDENIKTVEDKKKESKYKKRRNSRRR